MQLHELRKISLKKIALRDVHRKNLSNFLYLIRNFFSGFYLRSYVTWYVINVSNCVSLVLIVRIFSLLGFKREFFLPSLKYRWFCLIQYTLGIFNSQIPLKPYLKYQKRIILLLLINSD